MREDIAVQVRRNTRPVIVDCVGGARVVVDDPWTWELLRAADGAVDAAEVLARLDAKGLADGLDAADVAAMLDGELASWMAPTRPPERPDVDARRSLDALAELIAFARERVPFYRDAYATAPRELRDDFDLAAFPPLTKHDLRAAFPSGLLADGFAYGALLRSGQAEVLYSSGTTLDGDRSPSLHLVSEDDTNAVAPFGVVGPDERQARFSTPRCTGRECYIHQQARDDRTFGPNLILNSSANPMFMTDDALRDVAGELHEWEPVVLSGNPWYLAVLVRFLELEGLEVPRSVVTVLFGTEFAPAPVRRYVNDGTGLLPFDNYSASEVGNIANSCPLGAFHLFDSVHVEVIRAAAPAPTGVLGEVLVSNLDRWAMPMLRYRTGDLATRLDSCRCGLRQPALELHGRIAECLVSDAGFTTPRQLDAEAGAVAGLLFYRARQHADHGVSLEVVARPDAATGGAPTTVGDDLAARVEALGYRVSAVRPVERIHTRESMKFSVVVSEVADQTERVAKALGDG